MTSRARAALAVGIVVAGLGAAAAVLRASEARDRSADTAGRRLYVRSGDAARRLALSFDAVAADVYWIRAIQHYGRDKKSDRVNGRFELLQPLLDLTTSLDPYFNVAYRFGAVFLSLSPPNGPGRSDQAIALLEKGLAHNPARWQFAHDIGFVHYFHTRDYAQAARWFARAADMPDAPPWLRSLAATTSIQGGNLAGAEAMFTELRQSQERFIQQAAERGLSQVRALRAINELGEIVERFRAAAGRSPRDWSELIAARLLAGVPQDDSGTPFVYDAPTNTVMLSPRSPLAPLPRLPQN
jgi:tetratricopeptide (TPR) repeat protein